MRRVSHLVLLQPGGIHEEYTSQSQKSHFFAFADKHIMKLDNKMLKRNVQYIAPFISINTTFDTLNNLTAGATL